MPSPPRPIPVFGADSAADTTAYATAYATAGLLDRLEREWRHAVCEPAMQEEARAWAVAEPVLGLCMGQGGGEVASAGQVVDRVTWVGFRPSADGALVLSALLRQAGSALAARALLQALLPRIKAERVQTATYGHGVGESWPRPSDTVADLVAECFAAIKGHAGEDRDDVDRVIVRQAARRLRTARQVQHRYQARTVALLAGHSMLAPVDLSCARSEAEWLAAAVVDAVRGAQLTAAQARLLYDARVKGVPASEVGRAHGLAPKAVYHALARAERALLSSLAGPDKAHRSSAA